MAIREEIRDRQKKKSTTHLEVGLEKFSQLQLALLARLQELMRGRADDQGAKLLRLLAIIDPSPWDDLKVSQRPDGDDDEESVKAMAVDMDKQRKTPVLSEFRPLRIAFLDNDVSFMSSPLVETFTRLAWRGQEFVMASVDP